MNFFNRLTGMGKAILIIAIVAVIGCAAYFSGLTGKMGSLASGSNKVTLVVNTYCGFSPVVWGNGGLQGSTESEFYKRYGIMLDIKVIDDPVVLQSTLKSGDAQVGYTTLDVLPVSMGAESTMNDYRYFMLLNHSAGADALVVDGSVNTVADLKGKKVAYAEGSASHTLLINILETNGLTMSDITPVKVESGIDASTSFKGGACNAAAVWSPDYLDCVDGVKGSKVLASTKQANMLISDGLIASKQWLEENTETAKKLVEAILWANSEVAKNEAQFKEAAQSFAKNFESDVEFALASASDINYSTLQDELNWFGLNSEYTGMTGEQIYTKMSRVYTELGLTKSPLVWNKVAYPAIIEAVAANNKLDNYQDANSTMEKTFAAPTQEQVAATAISQKKVTINYPTAGFALDNVARTTIDKEMVTIIKEFANARIRITGNCDATGNLEINKSLSEKRAASVVDYLVKEHGINKNRLIAVGNGSKKALDAGVTGANAEYRTTDIEIIPE